MDDDDDLFDPNPTERLQLMEDELLQLAKEFHDIFAGDPGMEFLPQDLAKLSDRRIHNIAQILFDRHGHKILVAFALLGVERLIANEDEAALAYQRVLRAMAAIENTEPEPDEKIH